ncbi:uncharacterized protein A4U43_C10F15870 [Asparagus officinalis]|uniref:Uncharacterized protein n=1 Tax=Asparagus officinalis TaxID=4686 RepID=A0A5P1E313_ASPOF|nr:uncharacterized protein A4U43_C10F15870 [Asparagus officinalis]
MRLARVTFISRWYVCEIDEVLCGASMKLSTLIKKALSCSSPAKTGVEQSVLYVLINYDGSIAYITSIEGTPYKKLNECRLHEDSNSVSSHVNGEDKCYHDRKLQKLKWIYN